MKSYIIKKNIKNNVRKILFEMGAPIVATVEYEISDSVERIETVTIRDEVCYTFYEVGDQHPTVLYSKDRCGNDNEL